MIARCIGCFVATLLFLSISLAQTSFPRDTSFTLHATYVKEKKYRPYIRIAEVKADRSIAVDLDKIYLQRGSRKLAIDIFYPCPSKSRRSPGLLLIHGGGWRSGDKDQMHTLGRALAMRGYIAYAVEYRLSLEARYPAAVLDLKEAVRWAKTHADRYRLDTTKLASVGTSAGGQLAALLGMTNDSPLFQTESAGNAPTADIHAVIDIDGVLAFHHPESTEGKVAAEWLGGTYTEVPATWNEASPLTHVSSHSVPILFINSSIPRFHAGRDDMISLLQRHGIYTEVQEFDDTPHPFWFFDPWFDPMVEYIDQFLDRIW